MAASVPCGPAAMGLPSSVVASGPRCHMILPRSAVIPRAVAAPTRPVKSAVPELLDGRMVEHSMNFQEYTQATQMLNRLKDQASDLELLLDQLNALDADLDDSMLAPPVSEEPAARQAKRAAKRAERRAKATTAAVSGASTGVETASAAQPKAATAPSDPSPARTSTTASSVTRSTSSTLTRASAPQPAAPEQSSSTASTRGVSDVEQLEELFKLTAREPDLLQTRSPPASTSASASPAVLRPRKTSKKASLVPAPTAAPAATVPVKPEFETLHMLDHLLGPLQSGGSTDAAQLDDEDELGPSYAGPSDAELAALEREVASLQVPDEEDDGAGALRTAPSTSAKASKAAGAKADVLESSAMVDRAASQVWVSKAGPSLLDRLSPVSASAARQRQARRSARNGKGGRTAVSGGHLATPGLKAYSKDGTGQFISRSSGTMMSAEVEREVTEVCRDFLFLEKVKRQCQKTLHRTPTNEEVAAAVGMDVKSFILRYQAGMQAKEVLLKCNYKLVMTICKGYMGKGMHLQDMVSEGVKGLLRGVEMFDVTKGYRFGTYAQWWIRQAVSRSMAQTGRPVRLPTNMIEQLTKLKNAIAQLSHSLNREPTHAELAEAVDLPLQKVQMLLEAARRASSLETPVGGNEDGAMVKDTLQDDRGAADEEFGDASLEADIDGVLAGLPQREARVLRLRFGLEDGREWTLEEIGTELGVTRERIRQMEAKALRRLQLDAVEGEGGKLRDYSQNMTLMEDKELAPRNSLGTRKT